MSGRRQSLLRNRLKVSRVNSSGGIASLWGHPKNLGGTQEPPDPVPSPPSLPHTSQPSPALPPNHSGAPQNLGGTHRDDTVAAPPKMTWAPPNCEPQTKDTQK